MTEQAARPRRGHAATIAFVLGFAVVGASVWVATAPDAVATPGATGMLPLEVGESIYVGYFPLADDDLHIESIEPVTLHGPETALWLCDPAPTVDVIGAVREADLAGLCRTVIPFAPGTILPGRSPEYHATDPYLLVELTSTSDQAQALCAVDVTYRKADGWRTGRQRDAGTYRVGVNWTGDLAVDDGEDGVFDATDALLAACEGR